MMNEYEARLYEAVRSLFPLKITPTRKEGIPKPWATTGAIRLDIDKILQAEDLRTLFSSEGAEPSASSQFNDGRF
ncbi:MAG TPA: hypothetical protein PLI66_09435 [Spirochaetales bacterium]|nr:hypothetical protein [Spirochaetales bacterium]